LLVFISTVAIIAAPVLRAGRQHCAAGTIPQDGLSGQLLKGERAAFANLLINPFD